ncbi:hypothetical protein ONS95_013383 [Cadophora gregata]|uniref:uncharacterized protein n=1 Tax=Cadophora gregata TaxID=51156 RepID=UPI0026DABFED|nr:uncharacterized protein ONS95_013383 [Cadophora gregata]KAK0099723.1 hypothetical protein ONS96_008220 [Cadophora gregata f. sp. sojae]KAK0116363.1 hypothetical protein ONS95_013383 [Cadophora gregata]
MRLSIYSVFAILSTAVFAHPATEAAPLQARTNGWAIKNFTRTSSSPSSPVTYTLILDTYGALTNCTLTDSTNPAWYHAWYDLPCNKDTGAPYHLSWGWDYPGDFTVLTVESFPPSGPRQKVYFGYDHPNAKLPGTVYYPDQGYNAPQ